MTKKFNFLIILLFCPVLLIGQNIRKEINNGVKSYKKQNYSDAEVNFKKAFDKKPTDYNASFNLGDALYKQGKYNDAAEYFANAIKYTKDKKEAAAAYHNLGNTLLKNKNIEGAIESYKKSLKNNPNDMDTKYNLSYAQSLLKQQQNDKQQNKQNKDDKKQNQNGKQNQQNKDKNGQDKNNKDNKNDKQDQNKNQNQNQNNKQNKDNNKNNQDNKNQEQKQDNTKAPKNEISKEEAENILNAIKNNEKDLQKELRKQKGFQKNTKKDW